MASLLPGRMNLVLKHVPLVSKSLSTSICLSQKKTSKGTEKIMATTPKAKKQDASKPIVENQAATNEYKNTIYYEHGIDTYAEYEVIMAKSRLPQPKAI